MYSQGRETHLMNGKCGRNELMVVTSTVVYSTEWLSVVQVLSDWNKKTPLTYVNFTFVSLNLHTKCFWKMENNMTAN
jgi:hypothetical protein